MEPQVLDLLIDQQKHLQHLIENQAENITELKVNTVKKMDEVCVSIYKMREEIKDTLSRSTVAHKVECVSCKDGLIKEINQKVPRWIFVSTLTIAMAMFGWLTTMVVDSNNTINTIKPPVIEENIDNYVRLPIQKQ